MGLLLSGAYWVFSQGVTGGLYFDDMANLAPLSQVSSLDAAMHFIFSGTGGPTGRPLSLASFALQARAWPNDLAAFFQVNILIHLLNGALVAWFSILLANSAHISIKLRFALLLTALWLLSPLQVSPVLFIIQRMTLLSGTFTLLGLIFYLLGRSVRASSKLSWFWIVLAFLMAIPATLSKENGVLLPGFLLILEFFLLAEKTDASRSALRNKLLVIWAGCMVFLGAIILFHSWPGFSVGYSIKGYTPLQQVVTEARIVMQYLTQFILPNQPQFGPFHDDFPISPAWYDRQGWAAVTALLVITALAWWSRHRAALFSAGVFIFLWGHALESTVIPLELYFEHRNYIPILGLAMALTGLTLLSKKYQNFAISGLLGLILLFTFSTYQYASIWGGRSVAAQYWYNERPDSVRAVLHYADQLGEQGRWQEADKLVAKAWRDHPENMGFAMPMLYVACRASSSKLDAKTFIALVHTIQTGQFTRTSALIVHRIFNMVNTGQCPAFSLDDIQTMLDALGANPGYQLEAETAADFMIIRAKLLFAQGDSIESAELLLQAIGIDFRLSVALQAVKLFNEIGNHVQADRILALVHKKIPQNPWLRKEWIREIEKTEAALARSSESNRP